MKRLRIQVHLWLGLTSDVLGLFVGVTGATMWLRQRGGKIFPVQEEG